MNPRAQLGARLSGEPARAWTCPSGGFQSCDLHREVLAHLQDQTNAVTFWASREFAQELSSCTGTALRTPLPGPAARSLALLPGFPASPARSQHGPGNAHASKQFLVYL